MRDASAIHYSEDISDEDANTLRDKFLQRVQQDELKDAVHENDIRRAEVDLLWSKRFLAHCGMDFNLALECMVESAKFRLATDANDMTFSSIHRDFLDIGAVCLHGRDRAGARLFIFNARLHYKQSGDLYEQAKRFLVYWVEKIEREECGRRITLVFDMLGAGFSNIDIGFIQYLINLFKLYYPNMLQSIIVFEMPMLFAATWGIVKNMLPTKSHQLIKFVSRKDIGTVVDDQFLLTRWGGNDTWSYRVDEDTFQMPPSPFLHAQPDDMSVCNGHESGDDGHASPLLSGSRSSPDSAAEALAEDPPLSSSAPAALTNGHVSALHSQAALQIDKHKVHFSVVENSSTDSDITADNRPIMNQHTANAQPIAAHLSKTQIPGLVEVSPADELIFCSGSVDSKQPLILFNTASTPLAFKVKTTSPERYRVRPSGGVITPGHTQRVYVSLCEGVLPRHVLTDRFLVLLAALPHTRTQTVSANSLATLWKNLSAADRHELRFRCRMEAAADADGRPQLDDVIRRLGDVTRRLDDVTRQLDVVVRQTRYSWLLLLAVVLLLLLLHSFTLLSAPP